MVSNTYCSVTYVQDCVYIDAILQRQQIRIALGLITVRLFLPQDAAFEWGYDVFRISDDALCADDELSLLAFYLLKVCVLLFDRVEGFGVIF